MMTLQMLLLMVALPKDVDSTFFESPQIVLYSYEVTIFNVVPVEKKF